MSKSVLNAVNKYMNQAVQAVWDDDERQRLSAEALAQAQAQKASQERQQQLWTTTTSAASTLSGTTIGRPSLHAAGGVFGTTLGGAPSTSAWTNFPQRTLAVSFTDAQMAALFDKLAEFLSKGWECIRCHRIWSPHETGCEFCNFIDRLEGKDVERDTATDI